MSPKMNVIQFCGERPDATAWAGGYNPPPCGQARPHTRERMTDNTAADTSAPPTDAESPAPRPGRKAVHKQVDAFLDQIVPDAPQRQRTFMHQLVYNAARTVQEEDDVLNLKIIGRSIKELRRGFQTFAPWADTRKIAVFGSARSKEDTPEYKMTVECSKQLVDAGYMVVTGAGPGIMEAANRGAGRENSFGVNIWLPFEASANEYIDKDPKLVEFKYFFTRKVVFVKETDAVVLFPGGYGTQDELFETLTLIQTGKTEPRPVVMVEPPGSTYWTDWDAYNRKALLGRGLISDADLELYEIVHSSEAAVEYIERFYRNYHSIRYIDGKLVMRMRHAPTELLMDKLNAEFKDIVVSGKIEVCPAHPYEDDEPDTADLHRIRFDFNKRGLGRLRALIDVLSAAVTPEQARTGHSFRPVHRITPANELTDDDFESENGGG